MPPSSSTECPRPLRCGSRSSATSSAPTSSRRRFPASSPIVPRASTASDGRVRGGLIGELEAIGGPVDLVGHDWGGGFTVRTVSLRPDLVRSWVTDAAGLAGVNFESAFVAKIWQTPGEGEAFWGRHARCAAADRAAGLAGGGMPEDDALVAAEALNPSMASCILDLYRSATKVQDEQYVEPRST